MVLRQNVGKESSVERWSALFRHPQAISECRSRSEYEDDSVFSRQKGNLQVLKPMYGGRTKPSRSNGERAHAQRLLTGRTYSEALDGLQGASGGAAANSRPIDRA